MRNKRQDQIAERLAGAADETRSLLSRTNDLLALVRRKDLGRPTVQAVIRQLREIKEKAEAEKDREIIDLVDYTKTRLKFYRKKRKAMIEEKRTTEQQTKELMENPGSPPGPAYAGFKWQFCVEECRVVWRMVEDRPKTEAA
jgi:hypothetical protein